MKYEFHVGDYVETAKGDVGYVAMVDMGTGDVSMDIKLTKDGANIYRCYAFTLDSAPYLFNRIGQYDFTKPEQPKEIEKLTPNGWCMGTSGDDLIRKINELVDAVNELRKDYEEHLEAHRQTER